jgi:hypothetical protein
MMTVAKESAKENKTVIKKKRRKMVKKKQRMKMV